MLPHGCPASEIIRLRSPNWTMRPMTTEVDPVCKMKVEAASAKWRSDYKGKKYFFCAPGCKTAFDKDPEKYL
jgi:YHS domain-containing protein